MVKSLTPQAEAAAQGRGWCEQGLMSWSSKSHLAIILLCNFLLNSQFTLCRFRIIYSIFFQPVANPKEGREHFAAKKCCFFASGWTPQWNSSHTSQECVEHTRFPSQTCIWRCGNLWFSPAWAFCLIRHCWSLWLFTDTPWSLWLWRSEETELNGNVVMGQMETSSKYSQQRILEDLDL